MIDLSNTSCFILPKELHVSQALEEPLLMDFLLLLSGKQSQCVVPQIVSIV